jgi:hypothetical protein
MTHTPPWQTALPASPVAQVYVHEAVPSAKGHGVAAIGSDAGHSAALPTTSGPASAKVPPLELEPQPTKPQAARTKTTAALRAMRCGVFMVTSLASE